VRLSFGTRRKALTHRNDLVDHHPHRIVARVRVPVEVAAVGVQVEAER
jgi:hypothetical protein